MGNQKLFDYVLSEEMKKYLKDLDEQVKRKEGPMYEKINSEEVDSIYAGYGIAIEAGYELDREEFEKVANDYIKLGELIKEQDGELDLEMLEMVAGGMSDSDILGCGFGGAAIVVAIAFFA
jgi:hypothetical protein